MKFAPGPNSKELLSRKYCLAKLSAKQILAESLLDATLRGNLAGNLFLLRTDFLCSANVCA